VASPPNLIIRVCAFEGEEPVALQCRKFLAMRHVMATSGAFGLRLSEGELQDGWYHNHTPALLVGLFRNFPSDAMIS